MESISVFPLTILPKTGKYYKFMSLVKVIPFDSLSTRKSFISECIAENVRVDGRRLRDYRDPKIELRRDEDCSSAEIKFGSTFVVATVRGELVTPFPDRATEGILQFSVDSSVNAVSLGYSSSDLCRKLERYIRDSESIDLESLCVISGEKVWMIACEVSVIDFGGNALDACVLASLAALRAYRRADVSIVSRGPNDTTKGVVVCHRFADREPLPLAFHHTPLCISIGLFATPTGKSLLVDMTVEEEVCVDGEIVFSINGHKEVCGLQKPGGVGINLETSVLAARLAVEHAMSLHGALSEALSELEKRIVEERLEQLKVRRERNRAMDGADGVTVDSDSELLSWSELHKSIDLSSTTVH